jgi:uncharacterized protein DUF4349
METPRDEQLAADLLALRPTPRPEFAAELDERAAAGFPRRSPLPRLSLDRLRGTHLRRLLIPAGGVAVLTVAVVTVVVVGSESGSPSNSEAPPALFGEPQTTKPQGSSASQGSAAGSAESAAPATAEAESSLPSQAEPEIGTQSRSAKPGVHNRAVEHNAELVLGADPADVGDDSSAVFEAVHAHDGIVLRSSTREGEAGVAAARFELLIPSAKLGDALAALSGIDEVRSRHEATNDITAPTVTTGELLQDSKARVDSLLDQLASAETESEREAVEAELAQERRHRARLRTQLQHLERRADYSRVLVRIETGDYAQSPDEGSWGIGDAIDDAGQILAVAAAVTVVALAILGPIALVALLAWLAHRAWVRRERRRVLS